MYHSLALDRNAKVVVIVVFEWFKKMTEKSLIVQKSE